MQYNEIACNTIQYNRIQFNNMQYQKGILRPKQALFACFWPFSRTGWFQMGYNSAGWVGHSAAMLWTPNKPIFETKNVPHKIGPWKFRYQGQIALYGPPGDPEGARYQVKVCGHHESNPDGSMGGSWDQIWPLGALRGPSGPPKGPFGPKTIPFGGPRSAVEVR